MLLGSSFHHEQHQIYVGHRTNHGFVERAVERVAVPGLKARCVDKNKLADPRRAVAGDAVARGLRFA